MIEYETVRSEFETAIVEQLESIPLSRLRSLDPTDDVEEWRDEILNWMTPLSEIMTRDKLSENMIILGEEGLQSIIRQADAQEVEYSDDDILLAREYSREFVENRVDALMGRTTGETELPDDVTNPWLENRLDIATALAAAYLLRRTLRGNEQNEEAWSESFMAGILPVAKARSGLLAFNNLGRSFANGIIGFVKRIKIPVWKTWLMTTSLKPRDEHLNVVGESVRLFESFSHGQYWSQESINCKCGIRISFGREP